MKISKDEHISGVIRVTSDKTGPHVVLFGGVHGDEVSGVHAVEKLLFDFFGGTRTLGRGSLTLARANEHALAAERRYVKSNMNRLFRKDYPPEVDKLSYEFRRAQELKKVLEDCDYFLDLHSAPLAQEPFLVTEQNGLEFYAKLGIRQIMIGWNKFAGGAIGGDAENYARAHGANSATLESGTHFDKRSNDVAYRTTVLLLAFLEMIASAEPQEARESADIVDMYEVVTKEFSDFEYTGQVTNFKFFGEGEPFAFQNGKPLIVREDTYLLIPMNPKETKIGEELCYLGRKVTGR